MPVSLQNFVQETANNPGNAAAWNLAGAVTGFRSFVQAFGNGKLVFAIATDGQQSMWGTATIAAGSPNTLTWQTVKGNTAGTTAILNFTGAVQVYSDIPAEYCLFKDETNRVAGQEFSSSCVVDGGLNLKGSFKFQYDGSKFSALTPNGVGSATDTNLNDISIYAAFRMVAPEYDAVSDERLKQDIEDIPPETARAFVAAVRPRTFAMRDAPTRRKAGYIAQQLARAEGGAYDHMVQAHPHPDLPGRDEGDWRDPEGAAWDVSLLQAIPYLHAALRTALAEIDTLKALIAARP